MHILDMQSPILVSKHCSYMLPSRRCSLQTLESFVFLHLSCFDHCILDCLYSAQMHFGFKALQLYAACSLQVGGWVGVLMCNLTQ